MQLNRRALTFLLWPARAAFRLVCWLATSVGHTMVALASAFKACGRASADYGPVVILPQLAILAAWAPTRFLFLVLHGAAKGTYAFDAHLRRRLALAE